MTGTPPRAAGQAAGGGAAAFARIDWSAPWLARYAEPGRTFQADARIAGELATRDLTSREFAPLPALGVQGWCEANAAPAFCDPAVFRSGRRLRAADGGAQC